MRKRSLLHDINSYTCSPFHSFSIFKSSVLSLLACLLITCPVYAEENELQDNPVYGTLELNPHHNDKHAVIETSVSSDTMAIELMDVEQEEIDGLIKNIQVPDHETLSQESTSEYQEEIDEAPRDRRTQTKKDTSRDLSKKKLNLIIDLNNEILAAGKNANISRMPVLHQAKTSTCGTFASTAAIEMLMYGGNHQFSITQNLQLGRAIFNRKIGIYPDVYSVLRGYGKTRFVDPWNGTYPNLVLAQIASYGMTTPADSNDRNGTFSEKKNEDLVSLKKFIKPGNYKKQLFWAGHNQTATTSSIKEIKAAINKGNFVVVNMLLFLKYGNNGMSAKIYPWLGKKMYTSYPDISGTEGVYNTWILRSELIPMLKKAAGLPEQERNQILGAHIMVVIGYQNSMKNPDEGVLIVRNSWGPDNGNGGNNYIDYDYFKEFGLEAVIVSSNPIK